MTRFMCGLMVGSLIAPVSGVVASLLINRRSAFG